MATWTGEETAEGIERWLKTRRDEYPKNSIMWRTVDDLLNESRERAAEGWLPWQRLSDGDDD